MDMDVLLQDVGDRIRAERKARAWSRGVLAKESGTNVSSVRRIEIGLPGYTSTFLRVCKTLDVTPSYIFSNEWVAPLPKPLLTPRQITVIKTLYEGGSLAEAGARLGMTRDHFASHLSHIYTRLQIDKGPSSVRREKVFQMAREHGLI